MTLTGLFVWSSFGTSAVLTPPPTRAEEAKPVAPLTAAAPKTFSVSITGYNAVPEQTDSDPFTTASGAYSNPEIVAAVSRDIKESLPFGTVVVFEAENPSGPHCGWKRIEHLVGYRVIADTMNARHTNRADILFPTDAMVDVRVDGGVKSVNAAKVLASCGGITMRVVGKVAIKDIPETQAELAMRVEKTLAAK